MMFLTNLQFDCCDGKQLLVNALKRVVRVNPIDERPDGCLVQMQIANR